MTEACYVIGMLKQHTSCWPADFLILMICSPLSSLRQVLSPQYLHVQAFSLRVSIYYQNCMLWYNQAVLTIYPFSFHMQLYRYCLFQRGTTGLQQPIVMERFSYMTVYSMGASLQVSRNSLSAYTSLPFVTTS